MGTYLFDYTPEDLADERWGDWIVNFGPWIVTTQGIFSDSCHECGELFYAYNTTYHQVETVLRKVLVNKKSKKNVLTKVCKLFLNNELNPDIISFDKKELKEFEADFYKAVNFVKKEVLCH